MLDLIQRHCVRSWLNTPILTYGTKGHIKSKFGKEHKTFEFL